LELIDFLCRHLCSAPAHHRLKKNGNLLREGFHELIEEGLALIK